MKIIFINLLLFLSRCSNRSKVRGSLAACQSQGEHSVHPVIFICTVLPCMYSEQCTAYKCTVNSVRRINVHCLLYIFTLYTVHLYAVHYSLYIYTVYTVHCTYKVILYILVILYIYTLSSTVYTVNCTYNVILYILYILKILYI